MLQGMARGKMGDVVFSRNRGVQIARVRNRAPKNPKTNSQVYQRAIFATISKAYEAGKEIFNHAFEGYSFGQDNQTRFASRNLLALRQLVAADLNDGTYNAALVGPKSLYPVPGRYIVSEGTLPAAQMKLVTIGEGANALRQPQLPAVLEGETIGAYLVRCGYKKNDINTVVFFTQMDDPVEISTSTPRGHFAFIRFIVADGIDSETAAAGAALSSVFTIEASDNVLVDSVRALTLSTEVLSLDLDSLYNTDAFPDELVCTLGVIRSRVDSDVRSNCVLVDKTANRSMMYGWQVRDIIDKWANSSEGLGQSPYILEGGNF